MNLEKILILWFCFLTSGVRAQSIVPLTILEEGHLVVKVSINDVPGNFIVDTGGGITVLSKNFASKLTPLKKQDGNFTGFRATGEKMTLDLYTVDQLSMGSFIEKSSTVAIVDFNGGPIDGIISLPVFAHQPFTFDLEKKELQLESKQSLAKRKKEGQTVPLQLELNRDKALDVFAYFVINGKMVLQFCLDSGAGNDVFRINPRYMASLGIDSTDNSLVRKTLHPSETNPKIKTTIYHAKISTLSVNNFPSVKKENFNASFVDGLIYDGVVSINWLGKQITFDLEKSEMIVR